MRALVAPPPGGGGRNFFWDKANTFVSVSPSSRRAWIEMTSSLLSFAPPKVALLAEGVDRNGEGLLWRYDDIVALLAEGVDRNRQEVTNL